MQGGNPLAIWPVVSSVQPPYTACRPAGPGGYLTDVLSTRHRGGSTQRTVAGQGPAAPPGRGASTALGDAPGKLFPRRQNGRSCDCRRGEHPAGRCPQNHSRPSHPSLPHFQDFFALQADKHGPEILVRLQSIGGKPLGRMEAKGGGAVESGKGEAEKPASVVPPPLLSSVAPPERNVSVIQRTPNVDRPDPPKIILQRRVLEIPEHVRQEILAGIGSTDERGQPLTVKGVKGELSDPAVVQMGRRGLQKRKVPQGQRTNQQQSDHLVCQVCGERAGKHSYYGGQVGATKNTSSNLPVLLMTYIACRTDWVCCGMQLLAGCVPPTMHRIQIIRRERLLVSHGSN